MTTKGRVLGRGIHSFIHSFIHAFNHSPADGDGGNSHLTVACYILAAFDRNQVQCVETKQDKLIAGILYLHATL